MTRRWILVALLLAAALCACTRLVDLTPPDAMHPDAIPGEGPLPDAFIPDAAPADAPLG